MKASIRKGHPSTFGWTIPIAKEYNAKTLSVLIDLKPSGDELFYCELDTAFAVSCEDDWTTVIYRLNKLYTYELRGRDENHFIYDGKGVEIMYTTLYFKGGFAGGEFVGKWTSPPRSSTNGVLLTPDTTSFFFSKIREFDPHFLDGHVPEVSI